MERRTTVYQIVFKIIAFILVISMVGISLDSLLNASVSAISQYYSEPLKARPTSSYWNETHSRTRTAGSGTSMSVFLDDRFDTLRPTENGRQTIFSNAFNWMNMYEFS